MRKILLNKSIISLLVLVLFAGVLIPNQKANAAVDLGINADAAILIDAQSGRILYEKNADQVLGIASMTKMMTEYLLLEAISEGKITWDTQYLVSEYVYKISQDRALSNVPLRADGTYSIHELYQAMTIYSANAATIAIAETIAGSEANFVQMMNDKAEELGLEGYKFVNSTGLNNSDLKGFHSVGNIDEENVMTAKSTALLAKRLITDYPEILETASIPKLTFREGTSDEIEMQNWNWMLPGLVFEYEGVDGLKTGTTNFAGLCFTGTLEVNGTRYITVVMNARDENSGTADKKVRFTETAKMFNYAKTSVSKQEIIPEGYQLEDQKTIAVTKGKEKEVGIQTATALSLVISGDEKDQFTPVLTLNKDLLDEEGRLTAPVKKGDVVGTLTITSDKVDLSFVGSDYENSLVVDVIATEDVEKSNWFVLMFRGIGSFFGNLWDSVTGKF